MMTKTAGARRAGLSLVELVVVLVVTGVIGAALMGLLLSQTRLVQHQEASFDARSVPRAAIRLFEAELRRVDAGRVDGVTDGIVHATRDAITLRIPYAFGVACGSTGSGLAIALLPTDSVMLDEGHKGYSGYAWRKPSGEYSYVAAGSVDGSTGCSSSNIAVLDGGKVVQVRPVPSTPPPGTPAFLYQRVSYEFRAVSGGSGETELWRIVHDKDPEEEARVADPLGPESGFRFHLIDGTVVETPTNLDQVRGIQVELDGRSTVPGQSAAEAPLTTSIFFKNRVD